MLTKIYSPKIFRAKIYDLKIFRFTVLGLFGAFWCVNTIKGHFDGDTLSVFFALIFCRRSTLFRCWWYYSGNHCLEMSPYKFCFGEYVILYSELPNDYLIFLWMAVHVPTCMPTSLCGSSPSTRPHLPSRWEGNQLPLSWEVLCC